MKKFLLLAAAVCCFCAVPAQEKPISFQSYDAVIVSVSSNGKWAAGSTQGVGYFVNATTGKLTVFNEPSVTYDINEIADCGIAGGSYTPDYENQTPCYVTEDKGFVALPTLESSNSGVCMGASDDGSFLAGNMSISGYDENNEHFNYYQPVIWYRNASGEYDVCEELPFNKIGFDKRMAQGAWLLGISSDGLKLFGRIIDGSGTVYLPVMWERTSTQNRDWTYKELCSDYCFNKDEICPEWPQYKPVEPDATKYYSEEELAAFNKALDAYNDSVAKADWTIPKEERGEYPSYNPNEHEADFFDTSTPDGVERHNRYAEDYNKFRDEGLAYNDSIALYNERFSKYVIDDKRFHILNMSLSSNGKHMVTTTVYNTVMIDPETEEVTILDGADGLFPTAVLDDGTVFIGQKAAIPPLDRVPYVYSNGSMMDFGDWVRERSEKAYNDLMEKFPDGHFGIVASHNPEGLTFGGFNQGQDFLYVGWVMNLNAYDDLTAGISDAEIAGDDISVSYNREAGRIYIAGADNADVRIFAVNGSCVCNASCVSGSVPVSSLANGAYVVEVKAGSKVLRKKIILQ